MFNKKIYYLIAGIIFAIAFITRFYQLGAIPAGLEQDETSIGYNAYSILQTGKDEYGISYPLNFKAFGEYKLPGYIYATVPSIRIFGLNAFAVRFPSALAGFLTVVVFFFLMRAFTKNKNPYLVLTATAFLALNPWHIHFSRGAFEVTLALFFITSGVLLFLQSFHHQKGFLLFLSVLCFALSIYTYNIARLFTPILFIVLVIFYWRKVLRISRPLLIVSAVWGIILLLPFLLTILSSGGVSSASDQLIFSSSVTNAAMLELRSNLPGLSPFLVKLLFNRPVYDLWQYLQNIVGYLSVQFLFLTGSTHGNHGIGDVGQFYMFELPLMILGIYEIIKNKFKFGYILFLWTIFVIFIASLTREVPQATRSFFLIIPMVVFSGLGLLVLVRFVRSIKNRILVLATSIVIAIVVIYSVLFYFVSYYFRFPVYYAEQWRAPDRAVVQFIKNSGGKYNHILIDQNSGFIYSTLLFYLPYPPENFQKKVKRAPDNAEGFSQVLSFGKYQFKQIDWGNDYTQSSNPRTLIITTPDKKPSGVSAVATFDLPTRNVALSVNGTVAQYPTKQTEYVVVESE